MSNDDPAEERRTDHDREQSHRFDERDAKALTQYLTVLEDVGRVRGADDLYLVVSQSGREYLVDARTGTCECDDARFRSPKGGCKHARRVAFATGDREIPEWVDVDAIDDSLGEHVSGNPRIVNTATTETTGTSEEIATDGGVAVETAVTPRTDRIELSAEERRVLGAVIRKEAFDLETLPDFEVYCAVGELGVRSVEAALKDVA